MQQWETLYDDVLGEQLQHYVHPSGLDVYLLHKKDFSRKYAYFGTKYGSFDNCFTHEGKRYCMPKGIAHFLEHKIFEDPNATVFDVFAGLGASVNAYTSFNATVYHFSTVDNYAESLAELLKFVQRVNLTDENVEKEKGIIVQELKSYEDEADYVLYFNLLKSLYGTHPIRFDVGGDEENVLSTTREQLQTCFDAFYTPKNMVLLVASDMAPDELATLIDENLSEAYQNKTSAIKDPVIEEKTEAKQHFMTMEADIAATMFEFGVKGHVNFENERDFLDTAIAMKVLLDVHFGKSSDFYATLYNEGKINSSFGMDFAFGEGYAYYTFGGETEEPEYVVEKIKAEIDRIMKEGVDEEGYERIKRKMFGRLISAANSMQYLTSAFLNYYMKGMDLFRYLKAMHGSKSQAGVSYLKDTFKESQMSLVIAYPGGKDN